MHWLTWIRLALFQLEHGGLVVEFLLLLVYPASDCKLTERGSCFAAARVAPSARQAASDDAAQAPTQASRAMGPPATRAVSTTHGPRGGPSGAWRGDPRRREGSRPERRQQSRQGHGAAAVWPRQVWYCWLVAQFQNAQVCVMVLSLSAWQVLFAGFPAFLGQLRQ